jgi:uncharacterized membrane protein
MLKIFVIVSILLVIVGIYSLLAFLSDKRSHCVQGDNQICGNEEGGCCGDRKVE